MKSISLLFAAVFMSGSAFANLDTTFTFHYSNHNAYYACSFAETAVVKTLSTLGAEDIDTRCSGGIDNGQLFPVSVKAAYTQVAKGERMVQFKGNEACDFNVKLIKAALKNFDHEVVSAKDSCWDASGRYDIQVLVK